LLVKDSGRTTISRNIFFFSIKYSWWLYTKVWTNFWYVFNSYM